MVSFDIFEEEACNFQISVYIHNYGLYRIPALNNRKLHTNRVSTGMYTVLKGLYTGNFFLVLYTGYTVDYSI